jgi:hypothetical protein
VPNFRGRVPHLASNRLKEESVRQNALRLLPIWFLNVKHRRDRKLRYNKSHSDSQNPYVHIYNAPRSENTVS